MEPQDRPSKRQRISPSSSSSVDCSNQGAEGRVFEKLFLGRPAICKERFAKKYRHPDLDLKLRQTRMLQEARCLVACARKGIDVPQVYFVDEHSMSLYLERIDGWTVKEYLNLHEDDDSKWTQVATAVGTAVAIMHKNGIVHGDLTTSNMMIRRSLVDDCGLNNGSEGGNSGGSSSEISGSSSSSSNSDSGSGDFGGNNKKGESKSNNTNNTKLSVTLIDFGLGSQAINNPEDRAVDLYVLERAMASTHPGSETRLVPAKKYCNTSFTFKDIK